VSDSAIAEREVDLEQREEAVVAALLSGRTVRSSLILQKYRN